MARTAKSHRLALDRVADLAIDAGLRERLAAVLEERAASTWRSNSHDVRAM